MPCLLLLKQFATRLAAGREADRAEADQDVLPDASSARISTSSSASTFPARASELRVRLVMVAVFVGLLGIISASPRLWIDQGRPLL